MGTMTDLDSANAAARAWAYDFDVGRTAGWGEEIRTVPGAHILPHTLTLPGDELPDRPGVRAPPRYNGGVYTQAGAIVTEAVHLGGYQRNVPDPWQGAPAGTENLAGRWLYAGLLRGHFGHFLVESLGRLWALQAAGGTFDGIVYLHTNGRTLDRCHFPQELINRRSQEAAAKSFIRQTLEIFCGPMPLRVVGQPVAVEDLVVPAQMMGNVSVADFIGGHPAFRRFIRAGVAPLRGDGGGRRLYLSRSRLPAGSASFFLERLFEDRLRAEGYEIVHPETMTIREQLALYLTAEKVIAATGSALHLLAYALAEGVEVAVLNRQPRTSPKFANQLRLMGAARVTTIEAVTSVVRPMFDGDIIRINWNASNAIHVLDFDQLWEELRNGGFVTGAAGFRAEVAAQTEAELRRIRERLRGVWVSIEPIEVAKPRRNWKYPEAMAPRRAPPAVAPAA
jgi:capsular polysaccharide biosynthesis protein